MVELDDAGEALLQAEQQAEKRAKRFWSGFSDFALQDNVLEVAVGLMYVLCLLSPFLPGSQYSLFRPVSAPRFCAYLDSDWELTGDVKTCGSVHNTGDILRVRDPVTAAVAIAVYQPEYG
jgi:hypothetical protein